jgi:hypothetical protein
MFTGSIQKFIWTWKNNIFATNHLEDNKKELLNFFLELNPSSTLKKLFWELVGDADTETPEFRKIKIYYEVC